MALILPPNDLLLCVFVHGFKGDDSTFLDFPSRLAHNLQETIQHVTVESIVFPAYETKGKLEDAVERFVEWLQHEVLKREVSRAIEVGGERSAAGTAKVVLCGHSMGGLVIADALATIKKIHNDDGPLWPRIIALIAFDTPYLGLHPEMFKYQAEQGIEYASTAQKVVTGLGPVFAGLGGLWGATTPGKEKVDPTRKRIEDKSGPSTPSSQSGSWNKWAAVGGGVLAAGAAATAWYHRDKLTDSVTFSWGFVTDHFKYVGNLWNEAAMKRRLDSILEASKNHKILFRNFYTYLPKQGIQSRPRTFIILPLRSDPAAAYFVAAHNEKAANEIEAHMGMFEAKSNPGYYELGLKTAHLIREAVSSFLMENEKTMRVDEDFDEEGDLAKNRQQTAEDGKEAEATGRPNKPDNVDVDGPGNQ